uniref:Putative transcription initiation factor tfiid subunittfiid subunit n=1 Tax=Culex tarsalis TaxID=7177 RepID=A0A1Q3FQG5_CULTA
MFRFCLIASLLALVQSGPIPNNPINVTIFNIESFFEQSLGNLAGTLISHHKPNSTEHYQSSDGSLHADVETINLSLLQGIAFHPTNHQLIAEQATTLFNNATEEVDLIKVDLAPATSTTSSPQPEVATSNDTLKSIPSTVVSGTTASTTEKVSTTSSSSTSSSTTTTSAPTTKSVPVVIVTAVTESATTAEAGNVTTEATKPSTTTDDVSVKIKEVEAEPVILSSGV